MVWVEVGEEGQGEVYYCLEEKSLSIKTSGISSLSLLCLLAPLDFARDFSNQP